LKTISCRRLLGAFEVSKSRYYSYEPNRIDFDFDDFQMIQKHFINGKEKQGIRQLKMNIERKEGIIFNHKKIARIMKKYKLVTKIRRKNKYKMFSKKAHEHKTFPNLVNRKFNVKRPNTVYSTDITQINYGHKKAYLAAIKDLCTKEIVGRAVSNRIDLNLTSTALKHALSKLSPEQKTNLTIHSDQGFHFTHISYRKALKEHGITQSMSRKGNCLDNAPIESFFGHFKDLLDLSRCNKFDDLKKEVINQISYYNQRRPQLGINKMPPSEYRRHLVI